MSSDHGSPIASDPQHKDSSNAFELVTPRADALLESLRATGYALPDAVADLIDNSISASARNIWLTFHWDGMNSWFSLKDDGTGMTVGTLVNAMRMGSQHPNEPRAPSDLGRFGLGMKTSSISQARSLTVCTKHKDEQETHARRWDLDHIASVKDWQLLRTLSDLGTEFSTSLDDLQQGTLVIWEKPDRMVGECDASDSRARALFLENAQAVEAHISMTFHRFMNGRNSVSFWIIDSTGNPQKVKPWDPFVTDHSSTQELASERLGTNEVPITVTPYVLPHHSRLSAEEHKDAGGAAGWNAHQGFYVYRNNRLLLAGDWLGLGYKKEEHYKLARIGIDLPNTVDDEWEIDVRKSMARPPLKFRTDLQRIAKVARERAVAVYRQRGKIIARTTPQSPIFVWQRQIRNQRVSYVINRGHPIVNEALTHGALDPPSLQKLFRLIEEYVPVQQIWLDSAEGDESLNKPFESSPSDDVLNMIRWLYNAFISQGLTPSEALSKLASTEAFGDHYEFIDTALAEITGGISNE